MLRFIDSVQSKYSVSIVEAFGFNVSLVVIACSTVVALAGRGLSTAAAASVGVYILLAASGYGATRLWLTRRALHPVPSGQASVLERIWSRTVDPQHSGSLFVATAVILVDRFYIFAFLLNLLVLAALGMFVASDAAGEHVRWIDSAVLTANSAGLGGSSEPLPDTTVVKVLAIADSAIGLILLGFIFEAILEATHAVLRQYGTGMEYAAPAHELAREPLTREPPHGTARSKGGTE